MEELIIVEKKLEVQTLHSRPITVPRSRSPSSTDFATPKSDVGKYVKLVPPFREAELDSYFIAFERVMTKLSWPKDIWALLLQCNFVGKLQGVSADLPIEESLD